MYLKENLRALTPIGNRLQDTQAAGLESSGTHVADEAAGADRVAEAHPLLVVGVVSAPQEVLVALEVGALVEHPAAAVHADGVAAAEVGLQVGVVAAAVVAEALEAPVLVEGDLHNGRCGSMKRFAAPLKTPRRGEGGAKVPALTFPMLAIGEQEVFAGCCVGLGGGPLYI